MMSSTKKSISSYFTANNKGKDTNKNDLDTFLNNYVEPSPPPPTTADRNKMKLKTKSNSKSPIESPAKKKFKSNNICNDDDIDNNGHFEQNRFIINDKKNVEVEVKHNNNN
jgi:hypothetical protein